MIEHMISEFLVDRRARALSPNTLEFYRVELGLFLKHLTALHVVKIADVKPAHIREYLIALAERRKPGGVHGAYRAVKAFFNWHAKEYEAYNPVQKVQPPKVPKEILDPLPVAHLKAMLDTCKASGGRSFTGVRDRAALLFLYDSGVRREEFVRLDLADLDLTTGAVQVRLGKGGKGRVVYVGARCTKDLQRWLRVRGSAPGPLFTTVSRKRLTHSGLRQIIRRRAAAAGIPVPSPHDFRRAFALDSLRNGADLFTIMRLMGHTSPAVLQRYIKLMPEDLAAVHARTSPADNL